MFHVECFRLIDWIGFGSDAGLYSIKQCCRIKAEFVVLACRSLEASFSNELQHWKLKIIFQQFVPQLFLYGDRELQRSFQ